MAKKKSNADELISKIISGVEDVKGIDISLLDLRDIENTVYGIDILLALLARDMRYYL